MPELHAMNRAGVWALMAVSMTRGGCCARGIGDGAGDSSAVAVAGASASASGATAPSTTPATAASAASAERSLRGAPMVAVQGTRLRRCTVDWAQGKPKPDGHGRLCNGPELAAPAFSIDLREATVADYRVCVDAGACSTKGLARAPMCNWDRGRWGPARRAERADDYPMNCVSWAQADAYCRWAGKRLPSRDEWEIAARGSDGRAFPWGDAIPSSPAELAAVINGKGGCLRERGGTCRVGQRSPEGAPFGLLDMAGNVSEWTTDATCARAYDGRCFGRPAEPWHLACGSSFLDPAIDSVELLLLPECDVRQDEGRESVGFRCAR